ncbi:MAG TPA: lytic transglycosylase domain-containing protein [Pseudolabrys sp.]
MESQAINEVGQCPESAGQRALRRVESLEVPLALSGLVRDCILNEIESQLLILSDTAAGTSRTKPRTDPKKPNRVPPERHETPVTNQRAATHASRNARGFRFVSVIGALLVALGLGGLGASSVSQYFGNGDELTGSAAVNAVVDRIIGIESNGRLSATNKNSSAAGVGQFIDETWLDMVRVYRPDLAKARTKVETLELRREAKISREITTRFAERNAALLRKRRLPVTAANVYLAHFAGGAGAVAILSAPENADAALVMASADATGRTKRDQIIKANPFLERFSVADLKRWADRKMHGPVLNLAGLFDGNANK